MSARWELGAGVVLTYLVLARKRRGVSGHLGRHSREEDRAFQPPQPQLQCNNRRDTFSGHEFSGQGKYRGWFTVFFYVKGRIGHDLVMPYVAAQTLNLTLQICGSHRHIHGYDSLQVKPEIASYYNNSCFLYTALPAREDIKPSITGSYKPWSNGTTTGFVKYHPHFCQVLLVS